MGVEATALPKLLSLIKKKICTFYLIEIKKYLTIGRNKSKTDLQIYIT